MPTAAAAAAAAVAAAAAATTARTAPVALPVHSKRKTRQRGSADVLCYTHTHTHTHTKAFITHSARATGATEKTRRETSLAVWRLWASLACVRDDLRSSELGGSRRYRC